MDTLILIALNILPIALVVALWPWFKRRHAKGQRFSNVTTVTVIAAVVLLCLGMSHFAIYIKILVAVSVVILWFFAYRFREQGPVVGAVLVGLAAIMLLAG